MKPPAAALAALRLVRAAADAFAAAGESTRGRHSESQGPVYLVGAIEIFYAQDHPRQPPLWPLRGASTGFLQAGRPDGGRARLTAEPSVHGACRPPVTPPPPF